MSSDFNIHSPRSIIDYLNPVVKHCQQRSDVQSVAMPALRSLASQIKNNRSIPAESAEAIYEKVHEIRVLSAYSPAVIEFADSVLSLISTSPLSVASKSSPCFIFDPKEYVRNKSLPPNYLAMQHVGLINYIEDAIKDNLDNGTLHQCLPHLISFLGVERGRIAREQGSKRAENFGVLRTSAPKGHRELITPIVEYGPYREHGQRFLNSLALLFTETEGALEKTGFCLQGPKVNEFTSLFHCQLKDKQWLLQRGLKGGLSRYEAMLFNELNACFPDPVEALASNSTVFITCDMTLEKEGKKYPLSHYVIFLDKAKLKPDSIDFDEHVLLTIEHQLSDFYPDMQEELNQCFMKCVRSETEQELKVNVATFRYLLAHIAPYLRGSAMVGELLEKALYQ